LAVLSTNPNAIGLRLANLELWLDGRGNGAHLAVPACHAKFMVAPPTGDGLTLRVRDGPLHSTKDWRSLFHDAETWQLWLDNDGRWVFVAPRHSPPPRQVAIDASFRTGEVISEFGASLPAGQSVYPLQDIDMAIVVNWLAQSGGLIVHAAGIDDDGMGYAFVGPSGAGKSTLAALLATSPSVTVLGEDQVIVKGEAGGFKVYGTPWHTDPARCSPGGVPLTKLFFLDRTAGHGIWPCGPRAGIERLLQDAFVPYYNRAGVDRILDTLPRLAEQVPFYTLGFDIGADVMALIREA
jgi:hypothetical protein